MTVTSAKITRYSETHILGTAALTHAKGTEEVLFVAPKPAEFDPHGEPALDHKAMFYSSPTVARTAWEDLSQGTLDIPAFKGRDLGEMAAHLAKQAK